MNTYAQQAQVGQNQVNKGLFIHDGIFHQRRTLEIFRASY
jgi:hypothetical protein